MSWRRPEDLVSPRVWWTFKAKDPETGRIIDYRVENAAEDQYNEMIDLMIRYFLPDEPMGKSLGILSDKESEADLKNLWQKLAPKRLSLICYKEGSKEILGVNMLDVSEKHEPNKEWDIQGKCLKDVIKTLEFLKEKADVYRRYNVDRYLYGVGIVIVPKYRGLGIAPEVLKARFPLMKAVGLSLTSTAFTGPFSQAAAKKAGYIEDAVIPYESLGNRFPFVKFPKISWPLLKSMSYKLR